MYHLFLLPFLILYIFLITIKYFFWSPWNIPSDPHKIFFWSSQNISSDPHKIFLLILKKICNGHQSDMDHTPDQLINCARSKRTFQVLHHGAKQEKEIPSHLFRQFSFFCHWFILLLMRWCLMLILMPRDPLDYPKQITSICNWGPLHKLYNARPLQFTALKVCITFW